MQRSECYSLRRPIRQPPRDYPALPDAKRGGALCKTLGQSRRMWQARSRRLPSIPSVGTNPARTTPKAQGFTSPALSLETILFFVGWWMGHNLRNQLINPRAVCRVVPRLQLAPECCCRR